MIWATACPEHLEKVSRRFSNCEVSRFSRPSTLSMRPVSRSHPAIEWGWSGVRKHTFEMWEYLLSQTFFESSRLQAKKGPAVP